MSTPRTGRPRASSLEMLAESACELFLEQGFDATSITEIAQRAGVSRSSFFNYASSKSGLLWAGFDAQAAGLAAALAETPPALALQQVFADFVPDTLALAFANEEAMGLAGELERESAVRGSRMAALIAARERRDGAPRMHSEVLGAAYAGAVLTAVRHWSRAGSGREPLRVTLEIALESVRAVTAP